jgi:hypothetical protein
MRQDFTAYYEIVAVEAAFHMLPKFLEFLRESGVNRFPLIPETFPIDIYEYQNRLGVLFMMVLGESIIQLTTYNYDSDKTTRSFEYISAAIVYVFSVGMQVSAVFDHSLQFLIEQFIDLTALSLQYFDAIHRSHGKPHAMKRSIISHVCFIWLHPFLVYAMLLATVGLVMGYHAIKYGADADPYFNKMLAIGAFTTPVLFAFMRASHKGFARCFTSPSVGLHFFTRIALGFAHLGMWWYEGTPAVPIAAHAAISVVVNVIDIFVALRTKHEEMKEIEVQAEPTATRASYVERSSGSGTLISQPSRLYPGRRVWVSASRLSGNQDNGRSSTVSYSTTTPLVHDEL